MSGQGIYGMVFGMMGLVMGMIGLMLTQMMSMLNSGNQTLPGGLNLSSLSGSDGETASASGSSAAVGSNNSAAPVANGDIPQTDRMRQLAAQAEETATQMNKPGWCLAGVGNAIRAIGIDIPRRPSAYMAADTLAADDRFQEVQVSRGDLKNLPPGAVIVWDRYNDGQGALEAGEEHGHIAVVLSGGREASSVIGPLNTSMPTSFRVFLPQ